MRKSIRIGDLIGAITIILTGGAVTQPLVAQQEIVAASPGTVVLKLTLTAQSSCEDLSQEFEKNPQSFRKDSHLLYALTYCQTVQENQEQCRTAPAGSPCGHIMVVPATPDPNDSTKVNIVATPAQFVDLSNKESVTTRDVQPDMAARVRSWFTWRDAGGGWYGRLLIVRRSWTPLPGRTRSSFCIPPPFRRWRFWATWLRTSTAR